MALEMQDLEYIKTEFINPVIRKLDDLENTIKEFYENSMNLKNDVLDLKRCFDSFKEIHTKEHDSVWGAVRDLRGATEKKGKTLSLWLDVAWKFILIAGVMVTVVLALHKAGVL